MKRNRNGNPEKFLFEHIRSEEIQTPQRHAK